MEHNEDIDNKIFDLLDEADLAIADLTYARPSVYYEAGYALGRAKPVVYIARKDHFRARDDDPAGLSRVHFDLQMKNIIPWSTANDAFSKRLARRLRHVLRPLLRERDAQQKRQDERSRFDRLAQEDRIELLKTKAIRLMETTAFSLQEPERRVGSPSWVPGPWVVRASKASKRRRRDVEVLCTPSAVKKDFDNFQLRSLGIYKPIEFHYVVVSLKSVPRSRMTQGLSSFNSLGDNTFHRRQESQITHTGVDVFVHVIDGCGPSQSSQTLSV